MSGSTAGAAGGGGEAGTAGGLGVWVGRVVVVVVWARVVWAAVGMVRVSINQDVPKLTAPPQHSALGIFLFYCCS
jgi:hypothetical protein